MEIFLAAPLDSLLELFHFTAATTCEFTASDISNNKANLIIADSYQSNYRIYESQRLSNQRQHPLWGVSGEHKSDF